MRRELREELGIEVETGAELGEGWPIDERLRLRLFLARALQEPVAGGSHDRLTWLERGGLRTLDWLPSDAHALGLVDAALRPARRPRG